ncbi:MAG: hypothetical protein JWM87_2442 [Candidatus Eremiobacteraeota bacterium]|nr:hypothetical protein [Candidatus Eremiobacteraeota bacterium]
MPAAKTKPHAAADPAIEALFAGKEPATRAVYDALLAALGRIGPVIAEPKKTSIHLTAGAGTSAFAGVHPRKSGILLNIRSDAKLASARIRKTEQVSKNRHHNELLLQDITDVDTGLERWLAAAYRLSSG